MNIHVVDGFLNFLVLCFVRSALAFNTYHEALISCGFSQYQNTSVTGIKKFKKTLNTAYREWMPLGES